VTVAGGAVPSPPRPPVLFRLRGAPQRPERAFKVQFAGQMFGDYAVKIAAGSGPEMRYLLGRDDRQRHGR